MKPAKKTEKELPGSKKKTRRMDPRSQVKDLFFFPPMDKGVTLSNKAEVSQRIILEKYP